jgi:sialic acid synthase SpsE
MKEVFVIAEAGVNHNGDVSLAKKMIEVAANAGADCVKFQTFVPELVISRYAPKAEYQQQTTGKSESQLDMVRRLALSSEEHRDLVACAQQHTVPVNPF